MEPPASASAPTSAPAPVPAAELPAQGRDLLLGALSNGSSGHTNLDDLLLDSSAASTPAAVTHEVHWEGYVRKKGDWLPRWEERYLILDGATLTYYNSKEEARSARNLRGRMIISKVRPENYGKAHGFLLETQGHKHFHLCCATELEKDMWVEMMQAAIEEGVRHGAHSRVSVEGMEALQMQASPTQVDLRGFYLAFRQLLISHSSSPQFFPKLSRDVVLTSNYAPTVPFWGEYHGLDGVLHFFSILYETVEITAFFVTDIAQAKEGCTAVVAGRETMKNRDNGRKFTQQWQHTIEFAPDGRVKSLTISADPIAASAVFGCSATSSLSLPMAAVVGNTVHDNPPGRLHVVVFRGEQISDQGFIDDEEQTDESEADDEKRSSNRRVFLGMRLVTDGKTNVYAPTSSSNCVARTRTCDPDEARNPKWNSKHEITFAGSSRGKPCFILIEAWEVVDSDGTGEASERVVGVAKVNLAPFLALASTSRTVRESVIHSDIARGAVPQCDTETGQALAIKNIPNAFNDLIDAKRILREIRLMRHLNHPNLVNLLDLLRPPTLQEFNDVYIVTDLMETDLHRVIHSNQSISDDHVQYFLYQMLVAINYVHSAEVLHRDLKPSNILVNSDCDLKLCDFGLARGIQGMDSGLTEYVVTRWYRAPELLLSSKYDKQMDVWAIGCILAEMLGRRPLFPGHDYLHQLKIIMDVVGSPSEDSLDFITNPKAKRFILRQPKKPKVPLSSVYPRATPQCLDLLEKMLVFDPRKRITISEALEHPYLSLVRDRSLEKTCPTPFDFAFENSDLTKQKLQELIFEDVLPASAPEHERSAQAEVAIEIMQTPAHTTETAAEEVEASLDDIGSTPIHNVSVAEAAATVDESGATDHDAPNSTSTSSSGSDGEADIADAQGSDREIDLSTSPKKQVLQQPKSLLTPSSLV
ncbi:CMGC/MAPK protein kinase [Phytophthora cinnamomi]|uniref:CMGC/MAPK protein kinase n=1 Tax=Phytophthora cinnamomi TaxID=4785 RepID=UPI00355A896E|nr:CMGC/MAPK protein kinase [Phytophthora cinnamomi]